MQKHKLDILIGAYNETHRPDTVNFSRLCVAQRTTRSHASPLPTIIKETSPSMLEVPPPLPTSLNFHRIIVVQESKVDEKLWHISAFLTIPRHDGPCMLSPKRNALPKLSPIPIAPLPRHTLEFGTITNSQHLKSRNYFFALTTLSVVSKVHGASASTNSPLTKNNL